MRCQRPSQQSFLPGPTTLMTSPPSKLLDKWSKLIPPLIFHPCPIRHHQITVSPSVWSMPKISGKMPLPLQFTGQCQLPMDQQEWRNLRLFSRVLFPPIMRILRTLGRIRDGNPRLGKRTKRHTNSWSWSGTDSYPVFLTVTDIRPEAGRTTEVQRWSLRQTNNFPNNFPGLWITWRAKEFVSCWRKILHTG